jgi:hypothetical protein
MAHQAEGSTSQNWWVAPASLLLGLHGIIRGTHQTTFLPPPTNLSSRLPRFAPACRGTAAQGSGVRPSHEQFFRATATLPFVIPSNSLACGKLRRE